MGPHSWDPGITPSGFFWSTPASEGAIKVDLRKEEAALHVRDVLVFDGFTVANALDSAHPLGHVNSVINSLRMEWRGTTAIKDWTDCEDAFRGRFFEDVATIEVTATTPPVPASACPPTAAKNGFRFESDPGETTMNLFSQIGRERNGVFFA